MCTKQRGNRVADLWAKQATRYLEFCFSVYFSGFDFCMIFAGGAVDFDG